MNKAIEIKDPRKFWFKATGSTLLFFGAVIYFGVQWGHTVIDFTFMTDADAAGTTAELRQEMSVMVKQISKNGEANRENGKLFSQHITEFKKFSKTIQLSDAVDLYRLANNQVYQHAMNESRDGVTAISEHRGSELIQYREAAKEYRDCVINERKNCEVLRPR